MKKILLSVSLLLAQMLAVNAFAQVKGEVDESCSRAIPSTKCTAAEIAAAKAARKAEGAKAAKESMPGDATPASEGKARKYTKAQRKAAAAKRRAEAAAALKKGEIPSGEK